MLKPKKWQHTISLCSNIYISLLDGNCNPIQIVTIQGGATCLTHVTVVSYPNMAVNFSIFNFLLLFKLCKVQFVELSQLWNSLCNKISLWNAWYLSQKCHFYSAESKILKNFHFIMNKCITPFSYCKFEFAFLWILLTK